jgi:hypothetical protein
MKIHSLFITLLTITTSFYSFAQPYPVKPVRWVVPYAPGGGVDIMARLLAPRLAIDLGQPVVIDNRGGGGAILGTELVAKSNPDGYTFLFTNPAHVSNPSLNSKLPYDTLRDFTGVSLAGLSSSVLVVNPSVNVKTVRDLVNLAQAKPGQLNYASAGVGSAIFLGMELFKSVAKLNIVHIPYKGASPALTDVIGGQVPVMFLAISPAVPHIKSGKLRALGTGSAKGLSVIPEVPPIADTFPGFDHTDWYGLVAPAGTTKFVINVLNKAINQAFLSEEIRQRMSTLGTEPAGSTVEAFNLRLAKETLKWHEVFSSNKPH